MPVTVRRRLYPIGGGPPLLPEHELQHIVIVLDANKEVISKHYVVEGGRQYLLKDLDFTETDPEELLAMEMEAKLLAETKEWVTNSRGQRIYAKVRRP